MVVGKTVPRSVIPKATLKRGFSGTQSGPEAKLSIVLASLSGPSPSLSGYNGQIATLDSSGT